MKEITGKIGFCNLLVSWCFQLCDIFKVLLGGGQVDPGTTPVAAQCGAGSRPRQSFEPLWKKCCFFTRLKNYRFHFQSKHWFVLI